MWHYHSGRLDCFYALSYQYYCDLWVIFITVVIPLSHSPITHTVNAPLTITPPSLSLIAHLHIIASGVLFRGARHLQRIFVL